MGNDGGSIPDRRDLVRNRPKAEQADRANQTRARWFFCALSKRKLEEPVVSCALGKLYNKDSIIEYLLDKSAYGDGETICGHIRSLKVTLSTSRLFLFLTNKPQDVKRLNLALNPSRAPMPDGSERPQFICPLTLREMNGLVPFVYLSTCACVFSQAGLKTVTETSDELSLCPQCGKKYSPATDTLQLNPSPEEEENMREAMERQRLLEPPSKKTGKKRKAVAEGEEEPSKKKKEAKPSLNPSVAAASRAVASSLAMAEAERKAGMSEAIKSLYDDPNRKKRKETFTTMGTFTRYA
ncbi:hypothetical protein C0992_003847 [Termitomyces sp. T32_za158]|nr:hypothetical protein C0992_003847 [Termitomyces sp. T32_za158]